MANAHKKKQKRKCGNVNKTREKNPDGKLVT